MNVTYHYACASRSVSLTLTPMMSLFVPLYIGDSSDGFLIFKKIEFPERFSKEMS